MTEAEVVAAETQLAALRQQKAKAEKTLASVSKQIRTLVAKIEKSRTP